MVTVSFDRGTLVVRGNEADTLRAKLSPGALWDDRIQAVRAPAYRYTELLASFSEQGISFDDTVTYRWELSSEDSSLKLRPFELHFPETVPE